MRSSTIQIVIMAIRLTREVLNLLRLLRGNSLQERFDNAWIRLMMDHPHLRPTQIHRVGNRLLRIWRELNEAFPVEADEFDGEPNFFGPFGHEVGRRHWVEFVDLTRGEADHYDDGIDAIEAWMYGNDHEVEPEADGNGEVRDEDVPSEHLRGRVDMFGYFTESVVADIRRRGGVDVDTEFVVRSESELASE